MLISVIICTRDRERDLRETLRSLSGVAVPESCTCELLLVDNASVDGTSAVITETSHSRMAVRPLFEPRPGQSHARNLGLAEAQGEIVVFTDDDLRYPADWLENLTGSLRRGQADAVTGSMRLGRHLERPWMQPMHRLWLVAPPEDSPAVIGNLVGANMAFRREVLGKVPRFDPELGPGALGFGDDTLFGLQLREAGYRLGTVSLEAEHHFTPERLTRASFLQQAKKLGMTAAYTAHHWEHLDLRLARLNLYRKIGHLALWRWAHRAQILQVEGMHPTEMHHLRSLHLYGQALIERRRPRNYERHGLVKKTAG